MRLSSVAAMVLALAAVGRADISTTTPADVPFVIAAKHFEAATRELDGAKLAAMIDMTELEHRVMSGVKSQKESIHNYFMEWAKKDPLAERVISERRRGYSYDLVAVHQKKGTECALFRVSTLSGLFWYDEWVFAKTQGEQVKAVDCYSSRLGEYRSEWARRYYLEAVKDVDAGAIANALGEADSGPSSMAEGRKLENAYNSGNAEEVLRIYDALPQEMRREKVCNLYRVYAAERLRNTDPDTYREAIDDYQKLFPDDPSMDNVCIEGWIFLKDYPASYKALDHLDEWTGGDPFLKAVRARVVLAEGRPNAAKTAEQLSREATAKAPDCSQGHLMLMRSLVLQEQYDEAVVSLAKVEKIEKRELPLDRMQSMSGFVASDAYKEYRAQHTATQP